MASRFGKAKKSQAAARAVAVLLVAAWLCLIARVLAFHPNPSYGGRDEIKYILLAKMNLDPNLRPPSIPQYPPGWPALLSVHYMAGGGIVSAHFLAFALMCLASSWLQYSGTAARDC
jgi:hypothetical protein